MSSTTLYIQDQGGAQYSLEAADPDLYPHDLGGGQYELTASASGALSILRDDDSGQTRLVAASPDPDPTPSTPPVGGRHAKTFYRMKGSRMKWPRGTWER